MENKRILIVAAHPDDEFLGCGGTILKLSKNNCEIKVLFVSEGVSARFDKNTAELKSQIVQREEMARSVALEAKFTIIDFLRKPNLRMQNISMLDLVKKINNLINEFQPNVVYTHHPGDLNSDHRICYEAVITACRPFSTSFIESIFTFEVPSSTDWAPPIGFQKFQPNYFVNIESEIEEKIKILDLYNFEMRSFPHPRSKEMINSLARVRGASVGFSSAEAFTLIRSGLY